MLEQLTDVRRRILSRRRLGLDDPSDDGPIGFSPEMD
jgi:hypothetical protein